MVQPQHDTLDLLTVMIWHMTESVLDLRPWPPRTPPYAPHDLGGHLSLSATRRHEPRTERGRSKHLPTSSGSSSDHESMAGGGER